MTAYTATFSNGQTISLKNSKRINHHAWMATVTSGFDGGVYSHTGWSSSAALATKAARAMAQLRKPVWWNRFPETRCKKFVPDTVAVEIVQAVAQ